MKKVILISLLAFVLSGCQAAENTNVENKNTNANYNQNLELQKIRNSLKQEPSNFTRNTNAAQNQNPAENSNIENQTPRNSNKAQEKHEKMHEPEAR